MSSSPNSALFYDRDHIIEPLGVLVLSSVKWANNSYLHIAIVWIIFLNEFVFLKRLTQLPNKISGWSREILSLP